MANYDIFEEWQNRWSRFSSKWLGKIVKTIAGFMNVAALAVSVYSLYAGERSLSWIWILLIIAIDSLFLIAESVYESDDDYSKYYK